MTEIKNRNIFKVYLLFILLIAIFIFNNFVEKAKGQLVGGTDSDVFTDPIGIELQVFTKPQWDNLGQTTSAGTSTLDTRNNDDFYLFYNQDPKITVVAGTFYRLKLKNATSNFDLIFKRYFPDAPSSTFRDLTCGSAGGKIEGNDCIIEGMFTTTTNTDKDHEGWSISLIKDRSSSTIYFYLVPSSTAQVNVGSQRDQYYIIPRIAYATITDSIPSTSITYSIYYRKLYCPDKLAEGFLRSSPPSTGLSWNDDRVSRSDFQGGNISISRILNIFDPASGTYSIFVTSSNNITYQNAKLIVNNNITSPGEGQRDLRIRCEATLTISDQVYATYTISIDQNASGTPPYNYSIDVYQTVNNELATSTSRTNISELSYQFPFTLLATGTYRATATVQDSQQPQSTTTQASCGGAICGCVYLYRSGAGITSGWYERCREGQSWQLVYQTRDPNNFPYNDDRRNCICTRDSVDIRCRQR
jgi:hypothetical protein